MDIREVELFQAKMLENEVPVLILTYKTQEILIFKNSKGHVMVGKEVRFLKEEREEPLFTKKEKGIEFLYSRIVVSSSLLSRMQLSTPRMRLY